MSPRQRAYLDLLHRGLVLLRNSDDLAMCRIESDHLHNIPTLLYEANESRHEYYLHGERSLFLQRPRELGASDYLRQVGIWYAEPWRVLAAVAGVRLPAWDRDAEPGAANGEGGQAD